MTLRTITMLIALALFPDVAGAGDSIRERPDWRKFFSDQNATGTIVVADERHQAREIQVVDDQRANTRFAPASTFKIPHTLFALDHGAVRDEFQVFRWDGRQRDIEGHNQDQTLRSAMRFSTLWVYTGFAKAIGETKARNYLQQIDYGNADPSTVPSTTPSNNGGDYWVDGNLRISAHEQIRFLRKLYLNTLPFKVEHQRLVKDLIVTEAQRHWILRAKSGWEGRYGWWVGWVEWTEGPVFFALNIDTPERTRDLHKREAIVRALLQSIGALPKLSK